MIVNSRFPQKWSLDSGRVLKYGFGTFSLSVLFSIPCFFEYKVPQCETTIIYHLRTNTYYVWIYTVGIDLVVRYLFPIGAIFFTNIK